MILRKRKGMALITVVLIAALFLISIVGISAKVITEKKVSNARASSERALVAAETGLSQVLFNLRNTDFSADPASTAPSLGQEYLKAIQVEELATQDGDSYLPLGPRAYSDKPYTTYDVKIRRLSGTWDNDIPSSLDFEIYSLGTVYSEENGEVLARRVVSIKCEVDFEEAFEERDFSYGILAGGDVNFNGAHATEEGGDVFANGSITANDGGVHIYKDDDGNGGNAYSNYGAIDDEIAEGEELSGQAYVDVNALFDGYTQDMADAFKTGSYPYNGTVDEHPDTSVLTEMERVIIGNYIGASGEPSSFEGIYNFYQDLTDPDYSSPLWTSIDPDRLLNILTYAKNIVYYCNDVPKINNSLLNSLGIEGDPPIIKLGGIVVLDGDLIINGNVTIGDPDPARRLALIVRGEVRVLGGTPTFNGIIYARDGYDIVGDFNCNGALASGGDINIKGNSTITFQQFDLNVASTEVPTWGNIDTANQTMSSWKEISYEEFENPPSP